MRYALILSVLLLTGCSDWVDAGDVVRDSDSAIAIAIKACHPQEKVHWMAVLDDQKWYVESDHDGLYHLTIDKWDGSHGSCEAFSP